MPLPLGYRCKLPYYNVEGRPITRPSNFTLMPRDYQEEQKGTENCMKSDATYVTDKNEYSVKPCLA